MPDSSLETVATFGELLKYLRRRMQMTQQELGIALGYSIAMIARLENGERLPDPALVKTTYIEALGLEHEPTLAARLIELAAAARGEKQAPPDSRTARQEAPHGNLPRQLTRFVGRQHEVAEVVRLLDTNPLVTLTGSGGVGKTRLAIEVGQTVSGKFADGVWLVELASLTDPAQVPVMVAQVFGLPERADRSPSDMLTTFLANKRALIVLDNCEHLAGACAELVEALLRACPQMCILATSREALRVPGETSWRVPSLPCPDLAHLATLEQLPTYEAMQFFLLYATAAQPGFTLTAENAPGVAQICRRLDGIPLALEMAAAQASILSIGDIVAGLDDRFMLLSSGNRTALPRQQTLRATLDWSYDLLSEAERLLLERLAVFAGGWTADAARTVCADDTGANGLLRASSVVPLLLQLVRKSLVVVAPHDGQTRYSLLETIRQYAVEKLSARGDVVMHAVHERHLIHYLALAEETMDLGGRHVTAWVRRVETEYDNIRAAFGWARRVAEEDNGERMLRLAAGLRPYRHNRGFIAEGLAWLDEALVRGADAPVEARAKALMAQATAVVHTDAARATAIMIESLALFRHVDHSSGMAWCLELISYHQLHQESAEKALQLFRELGSPSGASRALRNLGNIALDFRNDQDAAARLFEESFETARAIDDRNAINHALIQLYGINPVRALELFEQEVARVRNVKDDDLLGYVLLTYGQILYREGDYEQARRVLQESMDLWRHLGRKWSMTSGIFYTTAPLGFAYKALGEVDRAIELWEEQLSLAQELNDGSTSYIVGELALLKGDYVRADASFRSRLKRLSPELEFVEIVIDLSYMGELAFLQGGAHRSMRLLGAAAALAHNAKHPRWTKQILQHLDYKQSIAKAHTRLSEPILAAAWAEGQAMTVDQAVAYALKGDEADAPPVP
jgi:predicted ATPase/transcriptional regulator with XRE-family HTH domain